MVARSYVRNSPDGGAIFTVTLPRSDIREGASLATGSSMTGSCSGRMLWAGGFEPVLFESAEAYVEAPPDAVCIVLDL